MFPLTNDSHGYIISSYCKEPGKCNNAPKSAENPVMSTSLTYTYLTRVNINVRNVYL